MEDHVISKTIPQVFMSSSKRNSVYTNDSDAPGPGKYKVQYPTRNISPRFAQIQVNKSLEITPGPGSYSFQNEDLVRPSKIKYSFGSSKRNSECLGIKQQE